VIAATWPEAVRVMVEQARASASSAQRDSRLSPDSAWMAESSSMSE